LYYKRLCQFAFLLIHSEEISEEVVLDVFINVWTKRNQLSQIRHIRSFLYTSVRNHAIDYQRTKTIHTQDYINVYELEVKDPKPAVDDMIDLELFRERLQKSFELLPERCRMIARLHYSDQLSYNEIADYLQISHKTARAQIAIATKKLKEIFVKYRWNKD
jgi:RNA polymerase sigma-70 factor (ECF subfamily)